MALDWLTETVVRQHSSADSFARGEEYERWGSVVSVVRRGDALHSDVEGSEPDPYVVHIALDAAGITRAECSCPYTWGGWCKHVVAVLLSCIHSPETIEERPQLATLLEELDRDQLQAVLLHVVERIPTLVEEIESAIEMVSTAKSLPTPSDPAAPRARRTPVDTAAIRRQVRGALHSLDRLFGSQAYYQVGSVVQSVSQSVSQAWELIEAGDGRTAIAILEAVTEEYAAEWDILDDSDGEASDFFGELGKAWTEAILTADLTRPERDAWARRLRGWDDALSDYSIDDAFTAAATAAEQGWEDPALVRVLQGKITELGAWEGQRPYCADDLAVARLHVLERQGRFEEYVHLSRAEGQSDLHATMLAKLGRTDEAVEAGLRDVGTAGEALHVAQALRERGEVQAALVVAEHGLTLGTPRTALAAWVCDLAAATGRTDLALAAGLLVLQETPSLAAYMRAQEIAGDQWLPHREEVLERLRRTASYYPQAQVDIFLYEGLVDDAIAAVSNGATHTIVEQVVDAVRDKRPEWAIATCRSQAESIMDAGKADYYYASAQWLAKARDISRATAREEEWRSYLAALIARHQRKYKLRPMLEALRN